MIMETVSFDTVCFLWTESLLINHKVGVKNYSGKRHDGVKTCESLVNAHTSI